LKWKKAFPQGQYAVNISKRVQSIKEDKMVALNSAALNSYEEKRQHPRFSVKLALDYWQTPDLIQAGLVANISETGLLIYSVHKIQIGAKLGIRVYLSKDNSLDCIEGKAKIMWMNLHREQDWKGYRYGVYIMQMPEDYQDRLMKYIFTLQQEESSSN
jgi:c-di-GMP-binding flagellar brake protein YcgR